MKFTVTDIVPCRKFILVKPLEKPTETDSGLVLPEQGFSPTPVAAEVISAGDESDFKAGDIVFFRRYSHDELKFYGTDGQLITLSLLADEEIVAKVKHGRAE